MSIQSGKQNQQQGGSAILAIIGFILLFTSIRWLGIILIIANTIIGAIKNAKKVQTNGQSVNNTKPIRAKQNNQKSNPYSPQGTSSKPLSAKFASYTDSENGYEQSMKPIRIYPNNNNRCEVCRTFNEPKAKTCELCHEILGDALKCGFCKSLNSLGTKHCQNCGIKFS